MPFREELEKQQRDGVPQSEAVWAAGDAVFARQAPQVAVPRRVSSTVIEIWEMQSWLEKRRPKAIHRLLGNKRFRAAYDFLLAREQIGEVKSELTDWWTHIQECHGEDRNRMINKLQGKPHSGKKKSRSRKQGRGGGRRSGQNPQRMMA
jgi:poly(A) polymerase